MSEPQMKYQVLIELQGFDLGDLAQLAAKLPERLSGTTPPGVRFVQNFLSPRGKLRARYALTVYDDGYPDEESFEDAVAEHERSQGASER